MAQEHDGLGPQDHAATIDPPGSSKLPPRDAVIEALLELAGERVWDDITITDIAARANLSLADFRDLYPSKGAVLGGFARKIDRVVLEGTSDDLLGQPAKERLFDVLMRRLDALAPYKLGIEGIAEWLGRAPLAAASINRLELNSMRFMLEAAGIESEGALGALKIQGLVLIWGRVLRAWFRDDDPGLATTMAVLDRELTRGGQFAARADDISRLASPLFSLARALFERRPASSVPESGDAKNEANEATKF
ncbi:MAG: TetR/AcrR family transcriptional regulator [Beijerinckiaceae bacterium]|nr:TetR/AcrR family transcriptional regulator [Beijerinckiaceae bacterium]